MFLFSSSIILNFDGTFILGITKVILRDNLRWEFYYFEVLQRFILNNSGDIDLIFQSKININVRKHELLLVDVMKTQYSEAIQATKRKGLLF